VASVEVTEHEFGGSEGQTLISVGTMKIGAGGSPASEPKQVTLITVRTNDGQEPVWEVENKGADWVRDRLTPVLSNAGISYYDDIPLHDRMG
jgi:acyl-coenzyme A synthetase/AMP-(fatty) acid ligase